MKKLFFLICIVSFIGCTVNKENSHTQDENNGISRSDTASVKKTDNSDQYGIEQTDSKHTFSARIIFTDSLGWGYQIFDGNKMMINQIHIPAIQGNKGFKSRQSAQITANFVLYKLSNNIFPPTVDAKELDSLGVL